MAIVGRFDVSFFSKWLELPSSLAGRTVSTDEKQRNVLMGLSALMWQRGALS